VVVLGPSVVQYHLVPWSPWHSYERASQFFCHHHRQRLSPGPILRAHISLRLTVGPGGGRGGAACLCAAAMIALCCQSSRTVTVRAARLALCLLRSGAPAFASARHFCATPLSSFAMNSASPPAAITPRLAPRDIDTPSLTVWDPEYRVLNTCGTSSDSDAHWSVYEAMARSAHHPFRLAAQDLDNLSQRIKRVLGTSHTVLESIAKYILDRDGQRELRPTVVVLMAEALRQHLEARRSDSGSSSNNNNNNHHNDSSSNMRTSSTNSEAPSHGGAAGSAHNAVASAGETAASSSSLLKSRQLLIAEIVELIHTASLLHRDVLDRQEEEQLGRRSSSGGLNYTIGNKLAVLAGDFLLSRASVDLAKIRSVPVTELISTVIGHIADGEVARKLHSDGFLQLLRPREGNSNNSTGGGEGGGHGGQRSAPQAHDAAADADDALVYAHAQQVLRSYLEQAFRVDGSLIASSCRATAILATTTMQADAQAGMFGGHSDENKAAHAAAAPGLASHLEEVAFQYGYHLSVAKLLQLDAAHLEQLLSRPPKRQSSSSSDTSRLVAQCGEYGLPLLAVAAALEVGSADTAGGAALKMRQWRNLVLVEDPQHVQDFVQHSGSVDRMRACAKAHAHRAMVVGWDVRRRMHILRAVRAVPVMGLVLGCSGGWRRHRGEERRAVGA
jgi:geranylgeranyl pyrophosphate synthase